MPTKKKVFLSVLAVLVLAFVILLIRTLTLIPEVQAVANATPTATPLIGNVRRVTPDPQATPTEAPLVLVFGSKGDEVTRLQQRLAELGYYTGAIDGDYGDGTRKAVRHFQEMNGLDADGKAGPATLEKLYSGNVALNTTPQPTMTPIVTAAPTATPAPTEVPSPARTQQYIRQDGLPLLVSAREPLPEDYESYDLVCLNDYCDPSVVKIKYDNTYAEREAVDALMVMLRAAQADGLKTWQISSAYRTKEYQQTLLDNKIREYTKEGYSTSKARTAALRYVNEPGTSEHQIGVCFDITVPNKTFASTEQSKWLAKHAWEYGFIQRYPGSKSSITGINNEAWHYRWVGIEHSTIMHNEDLCLEEYIERYGLIIEE